MAQQGTGPLFIVVGVAVFVVSLDPDRFRATVPIVRIHDDHVATLLCWGLILRAFQSELATDASLPYMAESVGSVTPDSDVFTRIVLVIFDRPRAVDVVKHNPNVGALPLVVVSCVDKVRGVGRAELD